MYNPIKSEPEILKFWEKKKIYSKAKNKCKKGKKFYFLDGPPYTSGEVHVGTAWNKVLKDSVLRYKRMKCFDVWDRAGYDMHGLPVENKVQAKLKLEHKEDIEKYGVSKFVKECKTFALNNLKKMNIDFKRLGTWMDFDNPYMSIRNEFIEGEWWLIKKAHENNRLYEGEKVMHWCPYCATALAKHELEYKNKTDDSIFWKFKIKNKKNEYLIIWSTTPWTIAFNLAVMVNPEKDYVKAKVEDEIWIVAKDLVGSLIQGIVDKKFDVIEEFKGAELENLEYEHPFYDELKDVFEKVKEKSKKIHFVILSQEYVDTASGSGLVHCAPGCGPEDYEVGHKYSIFPFNALDEYGNYSDGMGKFSGWNALQDNKKFIEELDKKGVLIAKTPVEHEYAHCWRCHNPVVFRTTKQWFFKIEDMIQRMRTLNSKVFWQPNWAGENWFDSWLNNLRDNGITRQRFWGAPLPVWKCDKCDNFTVIGSVKELKKYSKKIPEDLHKPYIDKIVFDCKCGNKMKRVPDILDVWIDAGTTSWTCLDYPQKENLFNKYWPADFILEGKDQIRGWFNLLLIASMVSMDKHCYNSVYMHGFVNDAKGRKMSKSLGNYISPYEVVDKYGSDAFRYYTIGGTNPGLDLNYNFEDLKVKYRNLTILYNLSNLLLQGKDYKKPKLDIEEKYMLSRLNSCIENTTIAFEDYRMNDVPLLVEGLFLELSRVYIQFTRDKIDKNPEKVYYILKEVLLNTLKLFAPIAPFITEEIYQNLKKQFKLKEESIHLFDWPKADKKSIDKKLEKNMEKVKEIISLVLAEREKEKIGVRWPLPSVEIYTEKNLKDFEDIIKTQLNVKEIKWKKGKLKTKLKTKLNEELLKEGYSRELVRLIQASRKKLGLTKNNNIEVSIITNQDLLHNFIKEKVGASKINIIDNPPKQSDLEIDKKIKEKEFKIFIKKL